MKGAQRPQGRPQGRPQTRFQTRFQTINDEPCAGGPLYGSTS